MAMQPVYRVTDVNDQEVQHGDTITDYRGEQYVFVAAIVPGRAGKPAKVQVIRDGRLLEFYQQVFNLNVYQLVHMSAHFATEEQLHAFIEETFPTATEDTSLETFRVDSEARTCWWAEWTLEPPNVYYINMYDQAQKVSNGGSHLTFGANYGEHVTEAKEGPNWTDRM